jgi:hypothetical protein
LFFVSLTCAMLILPHISMLAPRIPVHWMKLNGQAWAIKMYQLNGRAWPLSCTDMPIHQDVWPSPAIELCQLDGWVGH